MKISENRIEVVVNKIDDEKSTEEYMLKEKEKEKNALPDINGFNNITFIEYKNLTEKNSEIDFLFDYSKILGPDNNDTKITQWQMLNKDRLFVYGIDIVVLSERLKEMQKKGSNKMNNIISNLNYRLQRHGRLAPTKDIARKLQKKSFDDQMPLQEEEDIDIDKDIDIDIEQEESLEEKNKDKEKDKNNNNIFYNGNEENFYDINDPFIDDNLDEISEIDENNKLLFNLTLAPGNYTEKEILQNLKKGKKMKKFKKIKNINSSQKNKEKEEKKDFQDNNNLKDKDKDSIISAIKNILNKNKPKMPTPNKDKETTFLSKKTKRDPSYNSINSDNEKNRKKRKFDKSQLSDMSFENIEKLFKQILSEYTSPINTDPQKVSFINRNIKNIAEIYSRNPLGLCKVVENEFNINVGIANLLIEYVIFKSKIENFYSNFSKYLKNLNLALNNDGISKISSLNDLNRYSSRDNEIEKSIKHVIDNIYNFRLCFNEYIGRHYNDLCEIHDKLYPFIKDIKERNKGIIMKLSCKFDESEKEFEDKIPREIIVEYLKSKYTKTDFRENLSDDKNRIYALEDFVYKDKGNKTKIFKEYSPFENKENHYDYINKNKNKKNENKNNINDVNNNINIFNNEEQNEQDTFYNNLSFDKTISTSISSPLKYNNNNNNKNNSKTKYLDININKDKFSFGKK